MLNAKFPITAPELPGAMFASRQALVENVQLALAYERAVAEFAVTRDDLVFSGVLSSLGYDCAEIDWHVARPGTRMAQGYA